MVSALAEEKQIQEILNKYHKDTHIILEADLSADTANAERPGCGKKKHISVKYRYLQDAITNQEVWCREVGSKNHVADGLTKTVNQHVLRNMLTTLNTRAPVAHAAHRPRSAAQGLEDQVHQAQCIIRQRTHTDTSEQDIQEAPY